MSIIESIGFNCIEGKDGEYNYYFYIIIDGQEYRLETKPLKEQLRAKIPDVPNCDIEYFIRQALHNKGDKVSFERLQRKWNDLVRTQERINKANDDWFDNYIGGDNNDSHSFIWNTTRD